jgi:hypothetical protein
VRPLEQERQHEHAPAGRYMIEQPP